MGCSWGQGEVGPYPLGLASQLEVLQVSEEFAVKGTDSHAGPGARPLHAADLNSGALFQFGSTTGTAVDLRESPDSPQAEGGLGC